MAEKETILTTDGLKKLEQKLDHLKSVRRQEVAERIKQAIEFGDISENAEYEDAKNEQAFIEGEFYNFLHNRYGGGKRWFFRNRYIEPPGLQGFNERVHNENGSIDTIRPNAYIKASSCPRLFQSSIIDLSPYQTLLGHRYQEMR